MPLLKQSDGKQSASFTLMIIGFIVVTLWLLLSIVEELFGIPIRAFSSSDAMAYFTPLLMLYFSRRYTDSKIGNKTPPTPSSPSEDP